MSDTLKKVQPGDPLRIRAQTFNTFVDAARDYINRQRDQSAASQELPLQSGIILVKNASGANQDRFAVMGIDATIITPEKNEDAFKSRVAFKAVVPTEEHINKFVILTEPIPLGDFGRAMIGALHRSS